METFCIEVTTTRTPKFRMKYRENDQTGPCKLCLANLILSQFLIAEIMQVIGPIQSNHNATATVNLTIWTNSSKGNTALPPKRFYKLYKLRHKLQQNIIQDYIFLSFYEFCAAYLWPSDKFKIQSVVIFIWLPFLLSPLRNISESIWNFKWDIVSSSDFETKIIFFSHISYPIVSQSERSWHTARKITKCHWIFHQWKGHHKFSSD
jgi:hypothetical protein